jgi:hypothetical protein
MRGADNPIIQEEYRASYLLTHTTMSNFQEVSYISNQYERKKK